MNPFKKQPWVNVAVFEDITAGQALEKVLRGKEFEARVYHDRWLQRFLFLCPPRATYRVQVRQQDFGPVMDFLGREAGVTVQRVIHCPACGSLRINYPQMTRKFFLPTLLLHLGIIFRIIGHEAYCEHCHHTWNLEKIVPPELTKAPRPVH